jgi:hypothetical protein
VAAAVEFILVLCFRRTLYKTRVYLASGSQHLRRKHADDRHRKIKEFAGVERSGWRSSSYLPFDIPMETVPDTVRSINFIRVKPTSAETLRNCILRTGVGKITLRYDACAKDSLEYGNEISFWVGGKPLA